MSKFGLLGEHLGHSMSPQLHKMLGNYPYALYEVVPERLGTFLKNTKLDGMNVTIPYKKAVISYCTALSARAKRIGSVNTLVRRADGWYGDNTDYTGFCAMLAHVSFSPKGKKGLVLGSGGASKTVQAALLDLGAHEVIEVSRSGSNNYQNLSDHADARFIVNATPVGMFPQPDAKLLDAAAFPHCEAVFDLIYNPMRTELLRSAEQCGIIAENGLYMLAAQAAGSAELFLHRSVPDSLTDTAWHKLRARMENIVLIGMPGCGKSTVGKQLAAKTGKTFFDSDEEITKITGRTPAQILMSDGEEAFRDIEATIISDLSQRTDAILSCGGGAVLRAENRNALQRNGKIVWMRRDLNKLERVGRPLSENAGVDALFAARSAIYTDFADIAADNNGTIEATVTSILENLYETFDCERA